MKISKLFHWLYAILMFLPILVFIPNAFYYGFNETAVAQEKTEQVPVYYESNEINTISDLIIGNVYYYKDNFSFSTTIGGNREVFKINVDFFKTQFPEYDDLNIQQIMFVIDNGGRAYLYSAQGISLRVNVVPFYFVLESIINTQVMNDELITNNLILYTDYKFIKEYQPLVTNMSITDSMSYAWKSTWQNDLFSWSYDSFLTQPFLYITNLFNVPSTNTLLYCLSYWLNISIIWLCFDVIMYVPLLVHRWLDKGIVE